MKEHEIVWGIIGAGDVAEVKSGPAFNRAENSRLLAVMRRSAEKAADFAARHRVPQWYTDADELLAHEEINAVYIATPPSTHREYALRALRAGKHVYLEKPMAMNTAECEDIVREAALSRGRLTMAHYRRRLPAFLKVGELLKSGVLGDIRFVRISILQPELSAIIGVTESNWRFQPEISGGGLFYDIGPHQIDLMLHYFGTPRRSSGEAFIRNPASRVHDLVSGRIVFHSGVLMEGLWSFCNSPDSDQADLCEIYGAEGSVVFSFFGDRVTLKRGRGEELFAFDNPPHLQQPMIEDTVRYFLGEAPNPCSAEEGLQGISIMESFIRG